MASRYAASETIARLCTIREIAAEAGVGTTTVHRVIHDGPRLSPGSKAKVLAAITRLNASRLLRFTGHQRSADWPAGGSSGRD